MNENLCCYDFLIGKSNKEAAEACFSVANGTTTDGKIIFIYGESGCGKTHLLNTTHSLFCEKFPQAKASVVTLEQLLGDYMEAINSCNKAQFVKKCGENKLLLVDDLGFLVGKTATQEDMASVFRNMSLSGSTVILFSEYAPEHFTAFNDLFSSPGYTVVQLKKADTHLKERFLNKRLSDVNISVSPKERKRIIKSCGEDLSLINAYVLKLNLSLMLSGSVQDGKAVSLSGVLYDEKL